jgi:Flp pilus assembly protein TadG
MRRSGATARFPTHRDRIGWLGARLRQTRDDERGSATVEFVLWLPFFFTLLAGIADLSFVFTTNANMWDVARDTARRLALHQVDATEAEAFARAAVVLGDPAQYTVVIVDGEDVVVEITTSIDAASVFGVYGALMPGDLRARVTMLSEPQ